MIVKGVGEVLFIFVNTCAVFSAQFVLCLNQSALEH